MRWRLTAKRGAPGPGGGELRPRPSNIELVEFRHDSQIPFRTLQDAAAVVFIKRMVLTDEL